MWVCSLPEGHGGPHVACREGHHFLAVWDDYGYLRRKDGVPDMFV
jgi:hypothetical protein